MARNARWKTNISGISGHFCKLANYGVINPPSRPPRGMHLPTPARLVGRKSGLRRNPGPEGRCAKTQSGKVGVLQYCSSTPGLHRSRRSTLHARAGPVRADVHLHFFERKKSSNLSEQYICWQGSPEEAALSIISRGQPTRRSREGPRKILLLSFFRHKGGKLLWRRYIGGFVGFFVGFVIAGLLGDT